MTAPEPEAQWADTIIGQLADVERARERAARELAIAGELNGEYRALLDEAANAIETMWSSYAPAYQGVDEEGDPVPSEYPEIVARIRLVLDLNAGIRPADQEHRYRDGTNVWSRWETVNVDREVL